MIYINDDLENINLNESLSLLPEQRKAKVMAIRSEAGRRQSVAAYLLLCEALAKEYGITERPIFDYGENGKPFIVGHPDIHFNMSHCREAAVCVVAPHPIGIDIESIRTFKESLVRYTMNDEEVAQILAHDHPDVAFISQWTRKEAALKLSGEGIRKNMKNVLVGYEGHLETFVVQARGYIYSVAYQ